MGLFSGLAIWYGMGRGGGELPRFEIMKTSDILTYEVHGSLYIYNRCCTDSWTLSLIRSKSSYKISFMALCMSTAAYNYAVCIIGLDRIVTDYI